MRLIAVLCTLIALGCQAPAPTPIVDPPMRSDVGADVPVPAPSVRQGLVIPSSASFGTKYSVPSRSVADVQAFYVQRLPEFGWVFDKNASMLQDQPGQEKGLRLVQGCRTDGWFVVASFGPKDDGVNLVVVKQQEQNTLNGTAMLNGKLQTNTAIRCPS